MELSKRLQAIADMVTPGMTVADVGCDHGFVSIYLYEKRIAPKVIAMDLRPGPLQRAKEHIQAFGYAPYIETRLSDGVTALKAGETDALICAGMGGRLMAKIIEDGYDKVMQMKELILQPQSDLAFFREYLRMKNLRIVAENMIKEDGKYYPMMKVVPQTMTDTDLSEPDFVRMKDCFGPYLLENRNPVLQEYLHVLLERNQKILAGIQSAEGESRNQERVESLKQEINDIVYCLSLYQKP